MLPDLYLPRCTVSVGHTIVLSGMRGGACAILRTSSSGISTIQRLHVQPPAPFHLRFSRLILGRSLGNSNMDVSHGSSYSFRLSANPFGSLKSSLPIESIRTRSMLCPQKLLGVIAQKILKRSLNITAFSRPASVPSYLTVVPCKLASSP
jgi:hypothetical protein